MDHNQVVLRKEYIPSYKKRNDIEYYLHVISGTIEEDESKEECLKRELIEEAGIVIRDSVPITFESPLFVSKGCNSQYHICILPLYIDDYYEVEAKGDGSKSEKLSNSVKVYNYNISELEASDTITELCLMKIKQNIDI
jgi:8-oxo-dGTP pyrophosphatase MutT (NUDIX family)